MHLWAILFIAEKQIYMCREENSNLSHIIWSNWSPNKMYISYIMFVNLFARNLCFD